MSRTDELLVVAGISAGLALTLMLGLRLISPTRFAQALAAGLIGLGLAKLALSLSGASHV